MSCKRASKFLEENEITIAETVPASRKLGEDVARELAEGASRVIVAKGKKLSDFSVEAGVSDEVVSAMLGPTGNLRAPTIRVETTVLVGFNEETFTAVFG